MQKHIILRNDLNVAAFYDAKLDQMTRTKTAKLSDESFIAYLIGLHKEGVKNE